MTGKPISILHDEDAYDTALREFEALMDAEPERGTPEGDRLELLDMVIARYEDEHYPMPDADPVNVIKFVMEQNGYTQSDLADLLGSRSRASEILNRRADLSLSQIRKLSREWHIPADALIGELAAA